MPLPDIRGAPPPANTDEAAALVPENGADEESEGTFSGLLLFGSFLYFHPPNKNFPWTWYIVVPSGATCVLVGMQQEPARVYGGVHRSHVSVLAVDAVLNDSNINRWQGQKMQSRDHPFPTPLIFWISFCFSSCCKWQAR